MFDLVFYFYISFGHFIWFYYVCRLNSHGFRNTIQRPTFPNQLNQNISMVHMKMWSFPSRSSVFKLANFKHIGYLTESTDPTYKRMERSDDCTGCLTVLVLIIQNDFKRRIGYHLNPAGQCQNQCYNWLLTCRYQSVLLDLAIHTELSETLTFARRKRSMPNDSRPDGCVSVSITQVLG